MNPDNSPTYLWQRTAIGLIAIACIAAGIGLSFSDNGSESRGILVRVGLILAVTWLAFPQLQEISPLQTVGAFILVLGLIVLAASRPSLFRIVGSLVAIGLVINWAMKWINRFNKGK